MLVPKFDRGTSIVMEDSRFNMASAHAHLPHRDPFLFIDNAEIGADFTSVRTWYTFKADEYFFKGHFPGNPIVPGVILLECMAQAANVLLSHRAHRVVQSFLVKVDSARFNMPVRPNQTFTTDVRFAREAGPDSYAQPRCIVDFQATGTLENQRCARACINIYRAD